MVVQSGIAIVEQVPLRPILKWAGGVSGQFKMDINGHEKSPQNGQVKEEKSSPTRIGLVTATNPPIRGVSKLEESGDHCEYTRVPRSGTDQESYSSALGA